MVAAWREEMNAALGRARALAPSNPVAAQNEATRAQQIAQNSGNARTQRAVARAANEIRSINTTPGFYPRPPQDTGGGETDPGGDTDPGGGDTPDPDAWAKAQAAEQERRRKMNAIAAMRALMGEYGLDSLMGKITSWVQDGYNSEAIQAMIRTTPEYKERFPAMEALAKKGRALSEAEYIAFERNAAQLQRAYGLPEGLLSKSVVTDLLTNEVSGRELEQRVTMAATGALQAPAELKQTFRDFYGIDEGGLTAYYLDPDKALPLLERQYASAQIGTEARLQQLDVGMSMSERLQAFGVTREQARAGFANVAQRRPLTEGRGDIVTQEQLIGGELMGQQQAQQALRRAQGARVGRFAGGGSQVTTSEGVKGLGTAATR